MRSVLGGAIRVLVASTLIATVAMPWSAYGEEADAVAVEPRSSLLGANDDLVGPDADDAVAGQAVVTQTGDYRIDSLLSGYSLPGTTITYSFYEDDVFHGAYYGSEANVREITDSAKANVRQALAWYGALINVTFTEVPETSTTFGYLRFMASDGPAYAYAYYPYGSSPLCGDVHGCSPDTFEGSRVDYGFEAAMHEIGHTLGLKHPFEPRGTFVTILPEAEDNNSNTVMSYTHSTGSPCTPMPYDLLALQHMYGARSCEASDTVYAFTSAGPFQYALGSELRFDTGNDPFAKQTIWDSGGLDTLDASRLPVSDYFSFQLDLRGGGWIMKDQYPSAGSATRLALGDAIENVICSGGNDTIYANSLPNTFGGYTWGRRVGSDRIVGADSTDTVDLSTYFESEVGRTRSGNDLALWLGGDGLGTDGVVFLSDYYAGATPAIRYAPSRQPTSFVSLAGTDRYGTAASVSRSTFPNGADAVIIATGMNFPDALAASGLAGVVAAPVLLVHGSEKSLSRDGQASSEAARVIASRPSRTVYIIGGTTAVSSGIEAALKRTYGASNVVRLGGADRYETARLVATRMKSEMAVRSLPWTGDAFVVPGLDFRDALIVGPEAYAANRPILLYDPRGTRALSASCGALGITRAQVSGATSGSVGVVVPTALSLPGVNVTRIADAASPPARSVQVAQWAADSLGMTFANVGVATSALYPDGLAAGARQGASKGPLLLTPSGSLDGNVKGAFQAHRFEVMRVHYFGGDVAITPSVRAAVDSVLP